MTRALTWLIGAGVEMRRWIPRTYIARHHLLCEIMGRHRLHYLKVENDSTKLCSNGTGKGGQSVNSDESLLTSKHYVIFIATDLELRIFLQNYHITSLSQLLQLRFPRALQLILGSPKLLFTPSCRTALIVSLTK